MFLRPLCIPTCRDCVLCGYKDFLDNPSLDFLITIERSAGSSILWIQLIQQRMQKVAGSCDFILSTVNVPLDWNSYLLALRPNGRFILVGVVLEPIPVSMFNLLPGQRVVSACAIGSPAGIATILNFTARHNIIPITETFKFHQVNDAIEKLKNGDIRYRIVLTN